MNIIDQYLKQKPTGLSDLAVERMVLVSMIVELSKTQQAQSAQSTELGEYNDIADNLIDLMRKVGVNIPTEKTRKPEQMFQMAIALVQGFSKLKSDQIDLVGKLQAAEEKLKHL